LDSQTFLDQLAKADVHSKIEQVQEFYGDFYAVSKSAFSLNLGGALHMARSSLGPESPMTSHEATFQRSLDGVLGILLAHKIKPAIRYYHNSRLAQQFATAVNDAMSSQRELFGMLPPRSPAPLLLVLDRREDPVTPLLTQWTYQAMMHETLGLWNNRIDLSGSKAVKPDQQQIVMDPSHDDFYTSQMYSNFGEFAEALQSVLREHQATKQVR
jgi:vacuolar protein sorting-associated protein 45